MAEFLIKAMEQIDVPVDAEKASRRRRVGDIVVVMPDGHEWGREECLPKFYIVKIPGMTVEEAQKFTAPDSRDTGEIDPKTGKHIYKLYAKSRYHLLMTAVPAIIKNSLDVSGTVTVNWIGVRNFVHDKFLDVTLQ